MIHIILQFLNFLLQKTDSLLNTHILIAILCNFLLSSALLESIEHIHTPARPSVVINLVTRLSRLSLLTLLVEFLYINIRLCLVHFWFPFFSVLCLTLVMCDQFNFFLLHLC